MHGGEVVGGGPVVWGVVCVLGLVAECWLIIGLGRGVTRRYETEVLDRAVGEPLPLPDLVARQQPPAPPRAA